MILYYQVYEGFAINLYKNREKRAKFLQVNDNEINLIAAKLVACEWSITVTSLKNLKHYDKGGE